jgi:hypothetical protein
MSPRSRRGDSLVELIVALFLLEVAGAAALAVALSSERAGRHAALGGAADAARWQIYRTAETAPICITAVVPVAESLALPATGTRRPFDAVVRCGP